MLDANRRLNLTGAKDGAAFAAHMLDALTLRADVAGPLIDVGSGNGLPGIPLALATGARVVLLEPIKKRATFLAAALSRWASTAKPSPPARKTPPAIRVYREAFRTATARAVASAPDRRRADRAVPGDRRNARCFSAARSTSASATRSPTRPSSWAPSWSRSGRSTASAGW